MKIWGKIVGGTAGLALGGPIAALLGVMAGHAIDQFVEQSVGSDMTVATPVEPDGEHPTVARRRDPGEELVVPGRPP